MSRDVYEGITALRNSDGLLIPLQGIRVYVYDRGTTNLATIYQAPTGASQGPTSGAGATNGPNPFTTGPSGAMEFWCDGPDTYDIKIEDTLAPARISPRTFGWNCFPADDAVIVSRMIADLAVTSPKISAIPDGSVITAKLGDGAVTSAKISDGTISQADLAAVLQEAMFLPGDIKATARAAAPTGWAICDGTVKSQTGEWAALFGAIGNSYNIGGEGVGNFRLPDFKGRVPVGADPTGVRISDAVGRDLGESGGNEKHAVASHTHSGSTPDHLHPAGSLFTGNHSHSVSVSGSTAGSGASVAFTTGGGASVARTVEHGHAFSAGGGTSEAGNLGVGGSTGASDRSLAFTTSGPSVAQESSLQPYQVINFMIKK